MAAPVLQAVGPGNQDELLTTSLVNMLPSIRDNVFSSNTLVKYLYKTNKIKKKGGAALSHGTMYEANQATGSYSRYDILSTTPADGLTRDQWQWAQYYATVAVDGFTEAVANAGDSKIEDILEIKKMQSEESLSLKLEQHMFAAAQGAVTDLQPLAAIIGTTNTIGGISGTTATWWQARSTGSGSFAAQGRSDLTTIYNALAARNPNEPPDLIISSQTEFESYEAIIVPQERFTDTKLGDIGIQNLKFKTTPWIWSPQATAGTIFLTHQKALELIVHSDRDFALSEFQKPTNQDAKIAQIFLAIALVTGNRRKNGKLTSVTA